MIMNDENCEGLLYFLTTNVQSSPISRSLLQPCNVNVNVKTIKCPKWHGSHHTDWARAKCLFIMCLTVYVAVWMQCQLLYFYIYLSAVFCHKTPLYQHKLSYLIQGCICHTPLMNGELSDTALLRQKVSCIQSQNIFPVQSFPNNCFLDLSRCQLFGLGQLGARRWRFGAANWTPPTRRRDNSAQAQLDATVTNFQWHFVCISPVKL